MKKARIILLSSILLVAFTATAGFLAVEKARTFAVRTNAEKLSQIEARIEEAIELLDTLTIDNRILAKGITFEEKARLLTDLNQQENKYMMIRILDQNMNVYKEGVGLASNLSSRKYMQKLYKSGERQITDAFLAGADGKTINYTIAAAIKEDGKVTGALFLAIYGEEFDKYLCDAQAKNVLVGNDLQYMGGISPANFGMSVAQVLESEGQTSRPVENIMLDFQDKKSGEFWGYKDAQIQYFVYSPVRNTNWIVMTEISVFSIVKEILIVYFGSVLLLAVFIGLCCFNRRNSEMER